MVIEITSPNIADTYITCPAQLNRTLGIKLPILVLIAKNLKKFFTLEVQIMDDKSLMRRFRASNFQVRKIFFAYLLLLSLLLKYIIIRGVTLILIKKPLV